MEIVLQWLDEFDDFVFSVTMTSERLRHQSLQIGLISALALPLMTQSSLWTPLAPVVAVIATASVCLWGSGLFSARILKPRYEYSISRPSSA